MQEDQIFLEMLVKALVDHPSDVKITRNVDEMGVLLSLEVHSDDMGKIIGRSGNTAKAIRTLLRVVGMKNEARVNLKIEEPAGAPPRAPRVEATSGVADSYATPTVSQEDIDKAIDDLKI